MIQLLIKYIKLYLYACPFKTLKLNEIYNVSYLCVCKYIKMTSSKVCIYMHLNLVTAPNIPICLVRSPNMHILAVISVFTFCCYPQIPNEEYMLQAGNMSFVQL